MTDDPIVHFDAKPESALREAMNSPHDPECYWNTVDRKTPAELLEKPPICECRKSLKIRAAARRQVTR